MISGVHYYWVEIDEGSLSSEFQCAAERGRGWRLSGDLGDHEAGEEGVDAISHLRGVLPPTETAERRHHSLQAHGLKDPVPSIEVGMISDGVCSKAKSARGPCP